MAFLGKLRATRHYNAATQLMQVLNLADSWGQLSGLPMVIKELQKAVSLRPDFPEAWHNLGYAWVTAAQYNMTVPLLIRRRVDQMTGQECNLQALSALNKAVQLRWLFPEAHNTKAKALVGLGRWEDALDAVNTALEQKPDYSTAIANREEILRWMPKGSNSS